MLTFVQFVEIHGRGWKPRLVGPTREAAAVQGAGLAARGAASGAAVVHGSRPLGRWARTEGAGHPERGEDERLTAS